METLDDTALDLDWLRGQIVGVDTLIETPFGERLLLYADYTASGRSLHAIEDYLLRKQQLYANSHTEDDVSGRVTTELLHRAESVIKQAVNAGADGRIIACGAGATAAIDRMQQLVGVKLPRRAVHCLPGCSKDTSDGSRRPGSRPTAGAISLWCSSDPMSITQ